MAVLGLADFLRAGSPSGLVFLAFGAVLAVASWQGRSSKSADRWLKRYEALLKAPEAQRRHQLLRLNLRMVAVTGLALAIEVPITQALWANGGWRGYLVSSMATTALFLALALVNVGRIVLGKL